MPPTTGLDAPPAEVRLERLGAADRAARDRHVRTVRAYQAKSVEAAEALSAILDGRLYVEAGSFEAFALGAFGIRRRRAYQLAAAGRTYATLREAGASPLPRSEAQLRPLTALDGPRALAAWAEAVGLADGDPQRVTMEDVGLAVHRQTGALGTAAAPLPEGVGLAAVERAAAAGGRAPTEGAYAAARGLLGLLDPRDEAGVWARAAADPAATYDEDGRVAAVPERALRAAVVALADGLPNDGPAAVPADRPDGGLGVLLERHLLADGDPPDGAPRVGGSALLPHSGAGALVDALVAALDRDGGVTGDLDDDGKRDVAGRRRMARCRLEPEVATWAWAVLVPGPRRTATAWFPDPGAPAPCYVPARLTQPANTRPRSLDLRVPTARTALLAPGVDVLRPDVPLDLARTVLARAAGAAHLAFLVATNEPDRLGDVAWPPNVRPALAVSGRGGAGDGGPSRGLVGDDGVARALDAFDAAGVRGALVLDGLTALGPGVLGRVPGSA